MTPRWTLMAVTDDLDWPWDVAEPERGPLGWITRNDRVPGRPAGSGGVRWVAHATPAWSLAHLEDHPARVTELLRDALGKLLSGGRPPRWHDASVHRWRCAQPLHPAPGSRDGWWSAELGLGVCGDSFADG